MTVPDSGPIGEESLAYSPDAAAGVPGEGTLELAPAEFGGPGSEGALALAPAEFDGPGAESAIEIAPAEFSGPGAEGALAYTPTEHAAPVGETEIEIGPTQFAGPADTSPLEVLPSSFGGPGVQEQLQLGGPPVVPPADPPLPTGPVVPVVPPTSPPDVTGISAALTDPTLTPPQRRALIAKENAIRNLRVANRVATQRYTGPAYPFGPSVHGTLGPKDDFSVVVTSMINILTTPRGSVPYDLALGSDVPLLVFEPLDDITLNLIRYFTRKDLSEQEPRANIRQVFAQVDPVDPNRILVDVGFSLVGDPEGSVYGIPVVFAREGSVGGI